MERNSVSYKEVVLINIRDPVSFLPWYPFAKTNIYVNGSLGI